MLMTLHYAIIVKLNEILECTYLNEGGAAIIKGRYLL